MPPSRYPERAQQAAFVDRVLERVATLPSVASVAATSSAPFFPGTSLAGFSIEHRESPQRGFFLTHSRAVTPRYFETMGVPLVAGRAFSEADTAAAPPVVIVSQSFAQRYWPSQPAIGQRVKRGRIEAPTPWMEVVGVVGNLRENPSDTVPANDAWYLPYQQPTAGGIAELTYLIKTPQSGSTLQLVHGAVLELDPEVPVFDAMTMEERFARFTSTERLTAHLTTILAGLGVFLAAVGVYAVLAFSVRRRLPELGIRSALGARPIDIRRTVVRESSRLIAVGVAAGALVSLLLRPWLDPDLFAVGVSGTLAAVLAAGGTVLAAAASTVVPAARASRVDTLRAMAER